LGRQRRAVLVAGFIVALAAIPSMRWLAPRKIPIAEKVGSRALRADAMEAVTCGRLSCVVIATLAAQWLFDAGGSMASARWPSCGSWSRKAARLGRETHANLLWVMSSNSQKATDAPFREPPEAMDAASMPTSFNFLAFLRRV
jgi:hypothetical protein